MTSRSRLSQGYSEEQIDALIRSALRHRVAGATPPPDVWRRVQTRVGRVTTLWRAMLWMGLDWPLKAATASLSWVDRHLLVCEMQAMRWAPSPSARCDSQWALLAEHRIVMRMVS